MSVIRVEQLAKKYNDTTVLHDLSFDIKQGEIFGIVGHSGAGKSTLLRCFNGLESYQAGSISVMGKEVASLNRHEIKELRREMGMVFQTFNLMTHKNVFDNIAFPLQVWGKSKAEQKKRVHELLELVGLEDKAQSKIQNLSGGQKQRIGIARALALSPKILLCDEATSALDPKTTITILDLLEDIRKNFDLTIVMVTHQMDVVKRTCHRVLLLEKGNCIGLGKTEDFFLAPSKAVKVLVEEEFMLMPQGVNIRLWFPDESSKDAVITQMARDLDINVHLVGGKLERYITGVRGFLIINVDQNNLEPVCNYLQTNHLHWEIVEHE